MAFSIMIFLAIRRSLSSAGYAQAWRYLSWNLTRCHLDNVGSPPLFRNHPDATLVSSVRHPFLDRWIDRDRNHLSGSIWRQYSAEGILSPVSRLSAKKSPVSVSYSLGTFHPTLLLLER